MNTLYSTHPEDYDVLYKSGYRNQFDMLDSLIYDRDREAWDDGFTAEVAAAFGYCITCKKLDKRVNHNHPVYGLCHTAQLDAD